MYHCLAPAGLRTHQMAKSRYGAITVCDRPSTHILHQIQVMSDECDRFGVTPRPPDRRVVDSQIAEYELCDLVFVPSELNRRTFIERGVPAAKVCRVPFGVDLEAFRPAAKKDDIFRVLFVGQIGIRKENTYLLEAIAGLNLPRFELCLAGTIMPEGQQFLKKYEVTFRYLGVIPHPELRELYSQASVFVLASIEEGLAYVQAEAMACGLPVIATTNTGAGPFSPTGSKDSSFRFVIPKRSGKRSSSSITIRNCARRCRKPRFGGSGGSPDGIITVTASWSFTRRGSSAACPLLRSHLDPAPGVETSTDYNCCIENRSFARVSWELQYQTGTVNGNDALL